MSSPLSAALCSPSWNEEVSSAARFFVYWLSLCALTASILDAWCDRPSLILLSYYHVVFFSPYFSRVLLLNAALQWHVAVADGCVTSVPIKVPDSCANAKWNSSPGEGQFLELNSRWTVLITAFLELSVRMRLICDMGCWSLHRMFKKVTKAMCVRSLLAHFLVSKVVLSHRVVLLFSLRSLKYKYPLLLDLPIIIIF